LHDFPEFLCAFHFSLCDVIPPTCVQLRNVILSAYPRSSQLPDPFTPQLNVDRLPEAQTSPNILSAFGQALVEFKLKADLETYLKTGQPVKFVPELPERLKLQPPAPGALPPQKYNVPLINSLVLYVGVFAIAQLTPLLQQQQVQKQSANLMSTLTQSASSLTSLNLFKRLINDADPEGKYLILNAVANQLRFPSTHTHFFSCLLLYLFQEAGSDLTREQITRVLLERLIAHRPHPWGLLITFVELIKNKTYRFWDYSFTNCAPEIHRLFESVARSCMDGSNSGRQNQPPVGSISG
jgi:CCR4-NOT transcription complex subunit 1